MRLELALPAGDAKRLARLKVLTGAKRGRWRQRAKTILWHDTADGALAAEGLALAEEPRLWRLERLTPGTTPWPPGAPAPLVEQVSTLDRFAHALPTGLQHVARFEGYACRLPLSLDGVPLTLDLLRGTVGWARRYQPVSRLTIGGEEAGVLGLARILAAELPASIPTAGLAAEARATALAMPPPARRAGPPVLPTGLSVALAFAHVVAHLADIILAEAENVLGRAGNPEPVHQMRVAVRRLRSAFSVFRPAIAGQAVDAANVALKELADRLAPARDWDVFVAETSAAVLNALPDDKGMAGLRRVAELKRRAVYADLRSWLHTPQFRQLGITLAGMANGEAWVSALGPAHAEVLNLRLEDFAHRALQNRWRKMGAMEADIEHLAPQALHLIRLRAKRLRYVAEVFAPLFPGKATRRFLRRLSVLQDRLGVLNDGAVADRLLAEIHATKGARAHAGGLVRGFLAARAGDARGRIARAWQRFGRLEPFWT
jgi:triphosphatase